MDNTRDDLDDATLHALGRVAWNAINVEDRAVRLAEEVLGRWAERTPAGTMLDKAIEVAEAWPDPRHVAEAVEWLNAARMALQTRNAIMHGVPSSRFGTGEDVLVYFRRKGEGMVHTPLMPRGSTPSPTGSR